MFAKFAIIATLAAAFTSVQAVPQGGTIPLPSKQCSTPGTAYGIEIILTMLLLIGVPGLPFSAITIPTSFSASTTITGIQGPIGLGPSGVIVGSSTHPLTTASTTSAASNAGSTQGSGSKPSDSSSAAGSSSTGNSSSGAMGISAPLNAVVVAAAVLAGASYVL